MIGEDLIFIGHFDLAGQFRGKAVPAAEWKSRVVDGVGIPPANLYITPFGDISPCPSGPRDDLVIVPDPDRLVRIDFEDGSAPEHFALGSVMNLDGTPSPLCARNFAADMVQRLAKEHQLVLDGAFEHEFVIMDFEASVSGSFNNSTLRREAGFGRAAIRAMRLAGVEPDTFLAEYAPAQFEVTSNVTTGLAIADHAMLVREVVRATAFRCGRRISFSPVVRPGGLGNGVHVHLSLRNMRGEPITYDAARTTHLSQTAEHFFEGVRRAMPEIVALSAGSPVSYERLQPGRWSAAFNNLARQDREAGLRICPIRSQPGADPSKSFNVEFRAADATASPHLVLGAIIAAGLYGLRERLTCPGLADEDCLTMSALKRKQLGIERFPTSLDEALTRFESGPILAQYMPQPLRELFLALKRHELQRASTMSVEERFAAYASAY